MIITYDSVMLSAISFYKMAILLPKRFTSSYWYYGFLVHLIYLYASMSLEISVSMTQSLFFLNYIH